MKLVLDDSNYVKLLDRCLKLNIPMNQTVAVEWYSVHWVFKIPMKLKEINK